jgi:hypothetical protein
MTHDKLLAGVTDIMRSHPDRGVRIRARLLWITWWVTLWLNRALIVVGLGALLWLLLWWVTR